MLELNELIAFAINGVGVMLLVKLITTIGPNLSGTAKRIIVLLAGPVLVPVSASLANVLGYPIDLTPVIGALEGLASSLAAMGLFGNLRKVGNATKDAFKFPDDM